MNKVKAHFPADKKRLKMYLKIMLPIIFGSMLFALNGVVDNFMVGHIHQGQAALGAINSWTSIIMGYMIGTAAVGSVIMAQFYAAKKYEYVKQVSRYRFYLAMCFALPMAFIAWFAPDILTHTFYPKQTTFSKLADKENYEAVMSNARIYARVIAIQWLLITVSFNLGNQLREIGFGKHTMYWGIGTLAANVTLNSVLMYGVGMGVDGAAWASVAGRTVAITWGITLVLVKKIEVGFAPWTIFRVSLEVRKLFWRRWILFLSVATVYAFISLRSAFYSRGYVDNGGLGIGVTGLAVAALSGSIMNIFATTFSAIGAMSANFVASELGKGNLKQAKINADELKGLSTSVAAVLAAGLALFAFVFPYITFFSESKYENGKLIFDGHAHLVQVQQSLYVLALYYPMWIWFSMSYRAGSAGGKGQLFAIIDWVLTGLQVGWAAIVFLLIVPTNFDLQHHFALAYAIFFTSDIIKLVLVEWHYYTSDKWLHSITQSEVNEQQVSAKDLSELVDIE